MKIRGSISVVMPALNEEEGISATILAIPRKKLQDLGYAVEVIVVDGGSTDATVSLAKKSGARVIHSERGYGRQYKLGLKKAKGDILITGDSDGTYPFEDIVKYVQIMEKDHIDFITVNRFAHMDAGAMNFSNMVGNWGLTFFTNILFFLSLKDSQSGMWLIRKEAFKRFNLKSNGMPLSQEIKIEAFKKVKSVELPGRYFKRYGETKLLKIKDGFGNLKQLFAKRFHYD